MISVVIPAYNCMETIEKTLDSIRNQTYIHLIKEVIVVDDGSTDQTYNILNSYKNKYNTFPLIILNKKNGGVSSARNMGIKFAHEEWVALLDSDDYWQPQKIETQIKVLKKYPNIFFMGTNRNNEKISIGRLVDKSISLRKMTVKNLLFKSWPSVPTVIINKSIFDKIGYFKEGLDHGEDADFWLRVAEQNQLYYIEDLLVETGFGKKSFGESGLSANLKEMHFGVIKLICMAFENKDINYLEKILFINYENLKYLRRILITKCRR